tara:strand:+ start:1035 stop:1220 length:186 start_codon:yes stop_codon:yes gene_type:complete
MAKIETTVVKDVAILSRVTKYVEKNKMKSLIDKNLIVKEGNGLIYVYKHKDGSPVILGQDF